MDQKLIQQSLFYKENFFELTELINYIKSDEYIDINGYNNSTAFLNYRNRQCKLVAKKYTQGDLFSHKNYALS